MGGCLQTLLWVVVELVVGRVIDELVKRLTGRKVRLGWLGLLLAFFGIKSSRRR
jgi:hypothetical protein